MPWFALRDRSDADLRAAYRFIRSLQPAGQPAPAYLPPGPGGQGTCDPVPGGTQITRPSRTPLRDAVHAAGTLLWRGAISRRAGSSESTVPLP